MEAAAGAYAICKRFSVHIALTLRTKKTLNAQCLGIGADGIFGFGTERAVKKFQRGKGLTADGIVGRGTWAAIKKYGGGGGGTSAGGGDG